MLSSPMCVTPSTYTCAIKRVRAPISTPAPMMQWGPISALREMMACGSTMAAGCIAMRRLGHRYRLLHRRSHARLAILQHAHEDSFGYDHSIDRGLPVHFRDGALALGDLHLNTQLIARPH